MSSGHISSSSYEYMNATLHRGKQNKESMKLQLKSKFLLAKRLNFLFVG